MFPPSDVYRPFPSTQPLWAATGSSGRAPSTLHLAHSASTGSLAHTFTRSALKSIKRGECIGGVVGVGSVGRPSPSRGKTQRERGSEASRGRTLASPARRCRRLAQEDAVLDLRGVTFRPPLHRSNNRGEERRRGPDRVVRVHWETFLLAKLYQDKGTLPALVIMGSLFNLCTDSTFTENSQT